MNIANTISEYSDYLIGTKITFNEVKNILEREGISVIQDEGITISKTMFNSKKDIVFLKMHDEQVYSIYEEIESNTSSMNKLVSDKNVTKTLMSMTPDNDLHLLINITSDSDIFIECNDYCATHFARLYPLYRSILRNNSLNLIDEEGYINNRASTQFISRVLELIKSPNLPYYLRLQYERLFTTGDRLIIQEASSMMLHYKSDRCRGSRVELVPLEDVMSCIEYSISTRRLEITSSRKVTCNDWRRYQKDVVELEKVEQPLMIANLESFPFYKILTDSYANSNVRNSFKGDIMNDSINDEFIVNGVTVNPGGRLYYRIIMELFLVVTNLASNIASEGRKRIYLQDLALVTYKGDKYLAIRTKNDLPSKKDGKVLMCIKDKLYSKEQEINEFISPSFSPILVHNENIFSEDQELAECEKSFICDLIYFGLTQAFEYSYMFPSEQELDYISDGRINQLQALLLNYNFCYLEKELENMSDVTLPRNIYNTPLDPLGTPAFSTTRGNKLYINI